MKIEESNSLVFYSQKHAKEMITSRKALKQLFQKQSQYKFYGWDYRQNYTYITYLKYFKNIFESPEARKKGKVFTHISKLLVTRTSNQIKCHHQKMMIRHKSITGIIEYLRAKIITYLKQHYQAIAEIEKINAYCQKFFHQESGFQLRVRDELQHKKIIDVKEEEKQLKDEKTSPIKQEDYSEHYEYVKIKNSEFYDKNDKKGSASEEKTQE